MSPSEDPRATTDAASAAAHVVVRGLGLTVKGCDCDECWGKRAAGRVLAKDIADNYGRY